MYIIQIWSDLDEGKFWELSEILSSEENVETIVISSLAGKWDESNPHDMEIVKRLTDEFWSVG